MNKAIFITKDATLDFNSSNRLDPNEITLEHGVADGLAELKKEQYLLIILSSEPGIAHGHFKEPAMANVQNKILQLLHPYGITINGLYYCPHHPQGKLKEYSIMCFCRKPQPGLLLRASKDFNIDLTTSWMIGNLLDDIEAGNKAGCKTVLLDNGSEKEWLMNNKRSPCFEATNFKLAASYIVNSLNQVDKRHLETELFALV